MIGVVSTPHNKLPKKWSTSQVGYPLAYPSPYFVYVHMIVHVAIPICYWFNNFDGGYVKIAGMWNWWKKKGEISIQLQVFFKKVFKIVLLSQKIARFDNVCPLFSTV